MNSGTGLPVTSATSGTSAASTGGEPSTTGGEPSTTGEPVPLFTYHIGESQIFDGGGSCDNVYLNAVTSSLHNVLKENGWVGLRFVDDATWPEDFTEQTLSPLGLDNFVGDANRLSVYAGHGNVNSLQWGRPSNNGICKLSIINFVRLGLFAGGAANAVMLLASCTGRVDALAFTLGLSRSRQFFAYHNSPYIAGGEPRDVFELTKGGQSNAEAWINEMEDNIGFGKNSPVVMTIGTSASETLELHNTARLATGVGLDSDLGLGASFFMFEYIDNGCSTSCGNCPPAPTSVVEPAPLSNHPVLDITRPQRGETEIALRATLLSSIFLGRSLTQEEQSSVSKWATGEEVPVSSGSCLGRPIATDPGLFYRYDPRTDLLSITDSLNALRVGEELVKEQQSGAIVDMDALSAARREVFTTLSDHGILANKGSINVGTRKIGIGKLGEGILQSDVAEVRFSASPTIEGAQLLDAWASVGISPNGTISRLAVRMVRSKKVGEVTVLVGVESAEALMRDAVEKFGNFEKLVVEDVGFGYKLPVGADHAVVRPNYVFSVTTERTIDDDVVVVSRKRLVGVDASSGEVQFFEGANENASSDPRN